MLYFIKSCYSFLFEQRLRFGATFHFITFFVGFFSLPINILLCYFGDRSLLLDLLVILTILFYVPAGILSSFNKIEHYIHTKFYLINEIKFSKHKWINLLTYYFVVLLISSTCLSIPLLAILIKKEW